MLTRCKNVDVRQPDIEVVSDVVYFYVCNVT